MISSFITSRPGVLHVETYSTVQMLGFDDTNRKKDVFTINWFLCTVLPAKSDSDVVFFCLVIRDLESIDHLCINTQVINRLELA